MLTYLISVTGDLLAVAIATGLIFAFTDNYCGAAGRKVIRISLAVGFAGAAVRAYIVNTRRIAGGWKVGAYGYGVALAAFILLVAAVIIFHRGFFRSEQGSKDKDLADIIVTVITGLLIVSYLYCALPGVYAYPFNFDTGGEGILSTAFLFRLGGYLLGIIVSAVSAVCAYKIAAIAAKKVSESLVCAAFFVVNFFYEISIFAKLMLVLTPRKIIDSLPLFNFAAFSNNHSQWYIYICFIVLIILSAAVWIRSYTTKEPYANNAEHRRQRAVYRSGKRYSAAMAVCFVIAILCSTLFVTLNTVVIREAPVEEPVIIKDANGNDSELRIPLEMVNDGHLHRFGYTTDEGFPTRLIVILKQENTTNFGIGLDACEICGATGYIERENQIVCKLCDVVMNKSTIGLPGGCNPIPVTYGVNNGQVQIGQSDLEAAEKYFR